jgi:CheY-like chemotaxis protein
MDDMTPVVLVVDDNASVRRFLVRALLLRGLHVRDFDSGAEVLAYAAESTARVRLLVTDIVMPGMHGFDVASALRRRWPELPVLLLSGSHRPSDGILTESGPTRYLAKPFAYHDFLWQIDALLGAPDEC